MIDHDEANDYVDDGYDEEDQDNWEDAEEWQEGTCDQCSGSTPEDLERAQKGPDIITVCACAIGQGADRMTENNWLRRLEKAADEHEPGDPYRTSVFRDIIHKAWEDGRERGYNDGLDDTHEAQRAAERAAKEAT